MKKLILLLVLAAAALAPACATAQKIESKSSTIFREEAPKKKPANKWWALKLGGGMSISPCSSEPETSHSTGAYNLSISYNRGINSDGLYWGLQLGSSMIYSCEALGCASPTLYLGPKIGLAKTLSPKRILDMHAEVNYERAFVDDGCHFLTPGLGLGMWFKQYYIGIQYNYALDIGNFEDSNNRILVNLGLRF